MNIDFLSCVLLHDTLGGYDVAVLVMFDVGVICWLYASSLFGVIAFNFAFISGG